MKIAEVRDGEAFQSRRPAAKRNFLANDSRTVGRNQRGIDRERAYARGRCKSKKLSSGRRKKKQSFWRPLV